MSYKQIGQVPINLDKAYEKFMESGKVTPVAFEAQCAKYGFTRAKNGTSWDDMCMAHEYKNQLGPFAPVEPESFFEKNKIPLLIGATALLAWKLL